MNSYTAITASAGSGKTYTLVQRLLMVCLKEPLKQDGIRSILALTFTNKAAGEMKERILSWLGKFASDDYETCAELIHLQEVFANQGLKLSLEELHRRAKSNLDYVLHHYSTLNISTIDKFNTRLVRSFAYELGLPQNFNLEIEAAPFLSEAIDHMLNEIGEDPVISEAFMDYMNYSLDNDQRIRIQKSLYKAAVNFNSDVNYHRLRQNQDFDWQAYEEAKDKLRSDITALQKQSKQLAQNSLDLIAASQLEDDDFSGGKTNGIAVFFRKYINTEKLPIPTSSEEKALDTFNKIASTKGKKREADIAALLPTLLHNREQLFRNHIALEKKKKTLDALLPLKVNKEIQDKLRNIEEENDLLLLSRFNVMINESLAAEPIAFIYEKVGEQYRHYFFDEFQDTSALQWRNFIPLRDHALASAGTSFTLVGDPKQSIYRFRGGDARLMLDILSKREQAPRFADIENLDTNYRSSENIVRFNNALYRFIGERLEDDYKDIFGEKASQKVQSPNKGRVKISQLEQGTVDEYYQQAADKMRNDIEQCLANGFSFRDITLLCRGNKDIFRFSQLLSNMKVSIDGTEQYIPTLSDRGLTLNLSPTLNGLISYLQWYSNPDNRRHLTMMLYYLNRSGRITLTDFTAETQLLLAETEAAAITDRLAQVYDLDLSLRPHNRLNLYTFVEHYLQLFSIAGQETEYLLTFLEMLYAFSRNKNASLKDFLLYWDDKGGEESVQSSESVDAITIMTIHKSKGLEFPVVLLPFENRSKPNKESDWFGLDGEEHPALRSVNIQLFKKDLVPYDEQMLRFNQAAQDRERIDKLCLQYVATTRAVEHLYLYAERCGKTDHLADLFDFLKGHDRCTDDEFDYFPVSDGDLKKQATHKSSSAETALLHRISSPQRKADIRIATPSKHYQERRMSARIGIFAHEIMEKIVTADDVPRVVETYRIDGRITDAQAGLITERVNAVVTDDRYSAYFRAGLTVMNERSLQIDDNGNVSTIRPDRIVHDGCGWIIIDFKTGERNEAAQARHQRQLLGYKNALEKLGETVKETVVIYM
ncbi:MAG: DNA helicase UvrD [Chryseobacterium sp.]|nr:MAG: DNA helicase UvrD [Chryseobacterium sp.]